MRIIAGKWRTRRLARPLSSATRPVPDHVRESAFNMLGSHYAMPGHLPDLRVVDLFAGGGSMGLEALSRGALSCRFVERDPKAIEALNKNIDDLGAGGQASVRRQNAWEVSMQADDHHPFDLTILDPPYDQTADSSDAGCVVMFLIRWAQAVSPGAVVLLHHQRSVVYPDRSDDLWKVIKRRSLGSNGITIFQR